MQRTQVFLSGAAAALLFTACSGGSATTPATTSNVAAPPYAAHLPAPEPGKPRFLRLAHTPPRPPAHRHRITAAERERARAAGWQEIASAPSWTNGPDTPLQMTDGTILVHDYCTPNWYSLKPDQTGNYVNGTWTKMASMPSNYGPLYFASAVLADGKVMVNGGEYNGGSCSPVETPLGAIYDPVANSWTAVAAPSGWGSIGDAQSVVLDDGTYMIGNCCYTYQALLNETSLSWTQTGPGNGKTDANSEEGWALLPNSDVFVVNVISEPGAQLYSEKSNTWTSTTAAPVNLTSGEEIGPSTLRPDGTVFVAGASGYTAIYNSKSATFVQGPTFPVVSGQQLDVADGPSALLTDGQVMIPASPGLYQAPALFYLFNGKKLKQITAPPDAPNDSTYNIRLMVLPTGQVLEIDGSTDIEVYTSSRKGGHKYAPHISKVPTTLTHGNTYQISGKGFNGVSQTNMYGDDAQSATNYPLVRITNNSTGHVFYARTHGTTFMGVASKEKVSTMFDVPSTIDTGASTLEVIANGIASQPVNVTIQ